MGELGSHTDRLRGTAAPLHARRVPWFRDDINPPLQRMRVGNRPDNRRWEGANHDSRRAKNFDPEASPRIARDERRNFLDRFAASLAAESPPNTPAHYRSKRGRCCLQCRPYAHRPSSAAPHRRCHFTGFADLAETRKACTHRSEQKPTAGNSPDQPGYCSHRLLASTA